METNSESSLNITREKSLREQIASYLLQSRGVRADADAIVIGSSTQQILINLGRILQEDYSSIIVEDPGFDGAREAFQFHRFSLEYLPVHTTGADFSKLKQMDSRLIYVHSTTPKTDSMGK